MQAAYRSLHGYKYELVESYEVDVVIKPAQPIDTPFVALDAAGRLTIARRYAWDGPSGPTIDTPSFMRGSLVHDALYQLIRIGKLTMADREAADDELKRICREDGMSRFRAWYVHRFVRWFGEDAAKPRVEGQEVIYRVPPLPAGAVAAPPPRVGTPQ